MTNSGRTEPEMHVIPTDECYRLLGTHEFGRIGVVADHYPLILPVNYRLDGTTVVIRTHAGTILQAAEHANVTFEVDEVDRVSRSGWSVLVRASAEEVGAEHRDELIARTQQSGVEPWAPGDKGHWIRLITHEITGRRIVPGELPALDPRAYL
jgi:nitroimidazol reductase NimA-like FMN-containing flavoprotein (pyridoxamine 5'-phosphate oxidase superfamily)